LVLDTGRKMLKIQVKTTREPRIIPQREKEYKTYFYHVKRNGKGGKNHYADDEVDVFALVALDTRQVGYILNGDMPTSLSLRVDSMRGTYGDEQGLKHYNDIMELKGKMSQQEIADTLGISKTIVNKMCCKTYKPHISNAKYFDLAVGSLSSLFLGYKKSVPVAKSPLEKILPFSKTPNL
jgi:hypothetical protein